MKRALAWLAGLVGIAALGRWLTRRRAQAPPATDLAPPEPAAPVEAAATAADPAEELRRRLAERREAEDDGEPAAAAAADETLAERRARVHAKAREAMDAMRGDEVTGA